MCIRDRVYAGQYDNYGNCNQLINKLMDQEISSAQVFRVTNAYGVEFGIDEQAERSLAPVSYTHLNLWISA